MGATKRRRPVVAGLLAFITPGLGLLYVGKPWVALLVTVAPYLLVLLARLSGFLLLPLGMLVCSTLLIGAWFVSIIWCALIARGQGETTLAPYQRWYGLLGCYVVFGALSLLIPFGDWLGVHVYRIPSSSMRDTLQLGDYIVVDRWAYMAGSKPRRGDIVVVSYPARPSAKYARRIVGLPHEQLELRGGRLYVNGFDSDEPYLDRSLYLQTAMSEPQRYIVPEGSYFVLADNRDDGEDSRIVGAIPIGNILGRVSSICFSLDPATGLSFRRTRSLPAADSGR